MAITVINGGGDSTKVPITRTINNKKLSDNITLSASDVGALPDSTSIPSKTSDLANDSNYVVDASYVHTDNNYTTTDKDKLAGIATSATANTVLTLSGTLGTSWTGSAAPYTQSIFVSGILESDTPILDLICTTSDYEAEQEAWSKIFKAECSTSTITFYASEKPTKGAYFQVKVVR